MDQCRCTLRWGLPALLMLFLSGCDAEAPSPEEPCCEDLTGLVIYNAIGDVNVTDKKVGPFAAATTVTFTPTARASAGTGNGSVVIRLLLDGTLLCEKSAQGTGDLQATGTCTASFSARKSKTMSVSVVATSATRTATSVAVQW